MTSANQKIALCLSITAIAVITLFFPKPTETPSEHDFNREGTSLEINPRSHGLSAGDAHDEHAHTGHDHAEHAAPFTPINQDALQVLLSDVTGVQEIPVQLPSGQWEVMDLGKWRSLGGDGENSQWTGKLKGQPGSQVVVTRWKGAVFGSVFGREGSSEIRALPNGELAVYPVDDLSCEVDADADDIEEAMAPMVDFDADGVTGSTITVILAYNQQAADNLGGNAAIEAKMLTAVESANDSYAFCDIDMRLGIAWMGEVDYYYSLTQSFSEALNHVRNVGDGNLDELTDLRAQYGADFISLWLGSNSYGGLATVMRSTTDTGRACNIVRSKNPTSTFIHEMGHNMGCRHLRSSYSGTVSSWYSYSYANIFYGADAEKYATVMCSTGDANDENATRTPYFSGPNVYYQGSATGFSNDTECARTLRQNRNDYQNYRMQTPISVNLSNSGSTNTVSLQFGFVGELYNLDRSTNLTNWTTYDSDSPNDEGMLSVVAPSLGDTTFFQFTEAD